MTTRASRPQVHNHCSRPQKQQRRRRRRPSPRRAAGGPAGAPRRAKHTDDDAEAARAVFSYGASLVNSGMGSFAPRGSVLQVEGPDEGVAQDGGPY